MTYHRQPIRPLSKTQLLDYCYHFAYSKQEPAYIAGAHLTQAQFLAIAIWKSARPTPHYRSNTSQFIKEVTQAAFAKNASEAFRIQVLTLLRGVSYPVASALLHLGHHPDYPIIDFRTLWTLWGIEPNAITYDATLWEQYVATCRKLAKDHRMSVRDIDKALWQYSKKHQPRRAA